VIVPSPCEWKVKSAVGRYRPSMSLVGPIVHRAVHRARVALFPRLVGLPPGLMRRLAGPPVTVEGNTLSLQTQWMLRLMDLLEKPVESLPIAKGRRALVAQTQLVGGKQPIGEVRDLTVEGAEGELDARLYVPRALVGTTEPGPLVVFFHGGGMVYGDLESHDPTCRFLAEQAGVRVVAVDYRLAPEAPFPAGVDDAWAAYCSVQDRAAELGGDRDRMAVAGDSAGGYLSAAVALESAREGRPLAFQLLIYPMTDNSASFPSRKTFGHGYYLTTAFMALSTQSYAAGPVHPRGSVLRAEIPEGVAPAFVATAGFDPLRDEGEAYAHKLAEAGVPVQLERYPGEIHGFASVVGVDGSSRRAMLHVCGALHRALHS
jgi:acetyl esterase